MKLPRTYRASAGLAGAALFIALFGSSPTLTCAQGFGGPPPDNQSQGQQGDMRMPPPGGFGRRGAMMDRKVTAASAPVADWATTLKLTSVQQSQIAAIQSKARPSRRGMGMGGPGGMRATGASFGDGAPPPPPGAPGQGGGGGGMMDQRDAEASAKINALLSDNQRAQLASVLQQMDDLRATGIQPNLFEKLNLSADQKTKIASLATQSRSDMKSLMASLESSNNSTNNLSGDRFTAMASVRSARRKTRDAAYAVLTPTQLALAKSAERDFNQRGGPGNDMGGPPPGGFGGGGPGDESFSSRRGSSYSRSSNSSNSNAADDDNGGGNQDMEGRPPDDGGGPGGPGDDGGGPGGPPPPGG